MAKSLKDLVAPILFLAEGVFWLAIVATGGGTLLLLAAIAFLVSGVLLIWIPDGWPTRPMAGASALFGLTLTLYQFYEASTLFGTGLSTLGLSSGAAFGVFAIVSVYLELATLSMSGGAVAAEEP